MKKLWVPAERLAKMIDAHATPHCESNMARKMFDLRNGRQGYVSLDAADQMLTELDLHWLLYIPREKGGLADIYEDGIQYGGPDWSAASRPRPAQRKYATPEEKREARLATYRRYYQRKKQEKAA